MPNTSRAAAIHAYENAPNQTPGQLRCELQIVRADLDSARTAGAETLALLDAALDIIETREAEIARLERLLSSFARDQMQDKARARSQAGAVRRMYAEARQAGEPTGGWINTARGRVFIEVREL